MLQLEHRLGVEQVQLALATPLVLAAEFELAVCALFRAGRVGHRMSGGNFGSDLVETDASELRDVPVKYASTTGLPRPIASKICAPVYDATVDTPIFDMILSTPLPHALM